MICFIIVNKTGDERGGSAVLCLLKIHAPLSWTRFTKLKQCLPDRYFLNREKRIVRIILMIMLVVIGK